MSCTQSTAGQFLSQGRKYFCLDRELFYIAFLKINVCLPFLWWAVSKEERSWWERRKWATWLVSSCFNIFEVLPLLIFFAKNAHTNWHNLLVHLLHPQPWSFPPCTRAVCSRFLSCKILNVYLAHCSTEREHFGVFYFSEKSLGGCWGKRSPSWTFRPNRGLWRGTYAMRCLMFNKSQILQYDIVQRFCQIRW